jgi:hypothetical protein
MLMPFTTEQDPALARKGVLHPLDQWAIADILAGRFAPGTRRGHKFPGFLTASPGDVAFPWRIVMVRLNACGRHSRDAFPGVGPIASLIRTTGIFDTKVSSLQLVLAQFWHPERFPPSEGEPDCCPCGLNIAPTAMTSRQLSTKCRYTSPGERRAFSASGHTIAGASRLTATPGGGVEE